MELNKFYLEDIIKTALKEDIGYCDITSEYIFNEKEECSAKFVSKDNGIICGIELIDIIYSYIDKSIKVELNYKDGNKIKKGDILAEISGNTISILSGERTVLNFLQHMSGIATLTNKYVEIAEKYNVEIVDTRKTLPGLRYLQKYAVKIGGAKNHRIGLFDMVLIKDNHIKAAGNIKNAVETVKSHIGHSKKIEVETTNLEEVKEALDAGADIIMLDNFHFSTAQKAVEFINKKAITEISGNINLKTLEEYCKTGVDIISVGALTHSVSAFDISLKFN